MKMTLNLESCSLEEACTSLGESVKLLIELQDRLQDWLKLQPHLPQDVTRKTLEYFILGSKMSLEQAKQKLDMFYTVKRIVPELFEDRDPRGSRFTCLHKMIETVYLPKLTHEKYRVFIMRPYVDDYSKLDAYDSFKYTLMMEDILMAESRSLGSIFVFDHSKATFGFLAKYTPTMIRKSEVTATEGYAKRIKGIHFINAAAITEAAIALAKRALKPKLATRVHAHQKENFASLYEHIPKSILPKDYGGDGPSMSHLAELWRQKVDEKRDWFLEQQKIVVDERLRPGPAVNVDNLFGFSGSFRKLDVD